MSAATSNNTSAAAVANGQLLRTALIAAVVATVLNLIIYFIATSAGVVLQAPNPMTNVVEPIPFMAVVMSSVIPAFVGTGLLWALGRFTAQPFTIFFIISVVFTLLSFGGPFSLSLQLNGQLTLALMHVVEASTVVGLLATQARAR
ncbi:MAG: hypothetical protein HXY40_02535 [Chloroflexi bacterium]|nr:hypothetical protein [Chloroflexota bacterium]